MKLPVRLDRRYIIDSNDKLIAAITTVSDEKEFYDYVIRAVNSHADLVAALEVTKTMLADQPIGHAIVDVATMQTLDGVIADALAKAKGGSQS